MESLEVVLLQLLLLGSIVCIAAFLGTLLVYLFCPALRKDILNDILGE